MIRIPPYTKRSGLFAVMIVFTSSMICTMSQGDRSMNTALSLHMHEQGPEASLRVGIRNESAVDQWVLSNYFLQPPELFLVDAQGKEIRGDDLRALKEYDPTPYRGYYTQLKPGQEAGLAAASIEKNGSTRKDLRWHSYVFKNLPVGKYRARAVWASTEDRWFEKGGHKHGRFKNIWKGTLESNVVDFTIE